MHLPPAMTSLPEWLDCSKHSTFNGAEQLVVTQVIKMYSIRPKDFPLDIPETLVSPKGDGEVRAHSFQELINFSHPGGPLVIANVSPTLTPDDLAYNNSINAHAN